MSMSRRAPGRAMGIPNNYLDPHQETPFALTYGSKTMIPVEVGMPKFIIQHFDPVANNKKQVEELDFLEERREEAAIQTASNKRKAKQYFNKWVRPHSFRVGHLVLKKIKVATHEEWKLGPRWEGLYVVTASN